MSSKKLEAEAQKSTSTSRIDGFFKQRNDCLRDEEPPVKIRSRTGLLTEFFASSNSAEAREESATENVAELRTRLGECEKQAERREGEMRRLTASLEVAERNFDQYKEGARRALMKAVLELERSRLREEFEEIISKERRLGTLRNPAARSLEEWVDGVEILRLKEEKKKIQAEADECSAENKSVRSKRPLGEEETRLKSRNYLHSLTKKLEELDRELARLQAEKFELVYRQRRFTDNSECSLAVARPETGLSAWPCIGNYQFLSMVGRGGFSEVYKAYNLAEFRYVVCKLHQLGLKWDHAARESYIKHTQRENNVFKTLRHANIVTYYDTIEVERSCYATVLELCEGPDLDFYLKRQGTLNEKEARTIIKQVFLALKYLAEQTPRIIHYDIKPQNILFTRANTVKITDFGLCKLFDSEESKMELTSQGSGTYWYLPPECFEAPPALISPKVDIWSAGVVLFQMLYGRRPFGHNLSQDRVHRERIILRSTAVVFPEKPPVSPETKELIRKCLVYDQNSRIDAQSALQLLGVN